MGTPGHDERNYFRYLPVGRTDELWQLYVTTVGRITIGPGESYPYEADRHPPGYTLNWSAGRVLNEFQFVYVTRGAGRFRSLLLFAPLQEENRGFSLEMERRRPPQRSGIVGSRFGTLDKEPASIRMILGMLLNISVAKPFRIQA